MNAATSPLQTNQNRQAIEQLRTYMGRSIVGQREFVERLLIGLLADGHLFHNLLLADEINRAPAKVQSALL